MVTGKPYASLPRRNSIQEHGRHSWRNIFAEGKIDECGIFGEGSCKLQHPGKEGIAFCRMDFCEGVGSNTVEFSFAPESDLVDSQYIRRFLKRRRIGNDASDMQFFDGTQRNPIANSRRQCMRYDVS